jgi:hypothetical protein
MLDIRIRELTNQQTLLSTQLENLQQHMVKESDIVLSSNAVTNLLKHKEEAKDFLAVKEISKQALDQAAQLMKEILLLLDTVIKISDNLEATQSINTLAKVHTCWVT